MMTGWPTRAEMRVMQILQSNTGGAYGLQIVEDSEGLVKRGSVYVLLTRLEDKGYVRVLPSKVTPENGGLPRPKYQLTAEGSRVLRTAEANGMVFA